MATRKSNKTAHVLNLLSAGAKTEEGEDLEQAASDPVLEMNAAADDHLDDLIKQQLEQELDAADTSDSEDTVSEEPAPADDSPAASAPVPADSQPMSSEDIPTASHPAPPLMRPESAVTGSDTASSGTADSMKDYIYVNIVEELVKDRIDESIHDLGVCTCNRCRMDCIALALNNLPPKYCVMKPDETSPLLNYFSFKYQSMIIAQVTRACMVIKEKPNHE